MSKPRLLLGSLLLIGLVGAAALLPVADLLAGLLRWSADAGPAGALIFVFVYAAGTVLAVPGSLLTLVTGFAWGVSVGLPVVSLGATLGATAAFVIGRYLARDAVAARLADRPIFAAIDAIAEEDGFRIVVLLRLSPAVPYMLLNYALGLTRVRLRHYVAGTALGMVPSSLVLLYVGSLATDIAQLLAGERPSAGPMGQALLLLGLIATVAVVALVTRLARRKLEQRLGAAS